MKAKVVGVFALVLFASVAQLLASSLISKARAEKDVLAAVGGGTVIQAVLDTNMGKKTWSVDIARPSHEYEVWVDAHTGTILKIITQPPAVGGAAILSKDQAEASALAATSGGEVLQAVLNTNMGQKTWSVDVLGTEQEHEVWVDAHSGAVLKIITQPLAALAPCKFISKLNAEKDAVAAVGGGRVLSALLEKTDNPPVWSVNVVSAKGSEYEVKVNGCTGAIVAVIVGG